MAFMVCLVTASMSASSMVAPAALRCPPPPKRAATERTSSLPDERRLSLQRLPAKHKRYKELSDFDKKNAFDVERYLKHELRLRMDEEFDCYEVDVSEESTA